MKTMMKILALVLALTMLTCCFSACGEDKEPTKNDNETTAPGAPNPTDPTSDPGSDGPSEPDDGKKEYKVCVTDSKGNPLSGVVVQICREGSTCFTPTVTNEQGYAIWRLEESADYYGTVSSLEEGMPKEYFGDKYEVTLVYEVDDGKEDYKVMVVDAEGNPVAGVLVQICKEGSTCFTPTRTNEDGFAIWELEASNDYYGTVSSLEEGMPKEYFGDKFEVTLVYNPPVAE